MTYTPRFTRQFLNSEIKNVHSFFQNKKNQKKIMSVARSVCRDSNIIVDFSFHVSLLKNIYFFNGEDHWAETDGESIWLNKDFEYTRDCLFKTLLHESFHNMIHRSNGHELSEEKEHRIMELIDSTLL